MASETQFSPDDQRRIFGLQPTGTVAITGFSVEGHPTGFIVGTFQSLSLEPPLVTFCIAKTSSTWPVLRTQGRFTANILSVKQVAVCQALGRKGTDKFAGIHWQAGVTGTPRIEDSVAFVDCHVLSEVVAGDHFVIVGSVAAIAQGSEKEALIFRGRQLGQCLLWDNNQPPQPGTETMLPRIVRAWNEAWSGGNKQAFADLVSPDYVRHSKTGDTFCLDDILRQIDESHSAFDDFSVQILQALEKDDWVALRWRSRGRHTGSFMDVTPTQRKVTVYGASFMQHKNGRITQEWVVWDPRELLSAMHIWHLGNPSAIKGEIA